MILATTKCIQNDNFVFLRTFWNLALPFQKVFCESGGQFSTIARQIDLGEAV